MRCLMRKKHDHTKIPAWVPGTACFAHIFLAPLPIMLLSEGQVISAFICMTIGMAAVGMYNCFVLERLRRLSACCQASEQNEAGDSGCRDGSPTPVK